MKDYNVTDIRNVAIVGHGQKGKTSLCEAFLYSCGAIERLGTVQNGSTVSDFDPEEIKRSCSISTSIIPIEWANTKINILDTPGFFDFESEKISGLSAADCAVIVISGKTGVDVGSEKVWDYCKKHDIPVCFFINKLDTEKADFHRTVQMLKDTFGPTIAPFLLPVKEGDSINEFVNVVRMVSRKFEGEKMIDGPVPEKMMDEIGPVREMIMEAVAETDDELMQKYFDGIEFTEEEIERALRHGTKRKTIVPVICGSAIKNQGTKFLLDAIVRYFPGPHRIENMVAADKSGELVEIFAEPEKSLVAQCFKTISDPFIGRLSFVRVYQGTINKETTVYNSTRDKEEKIGKICIMTGKKQQEISSVKAGDIAVLPKLSVTYTGDTLCSKDNILVLETPDFPKPCMSMAIVPQAKGDEEKISAGLNRLMEEDPSLLTEIKTETHQQLMKGIGEQHIEVTINKLKNKFGVTALLEAPQVAYRETIRKSVKAEGKHKKQSGGHGQYGHVWIEFEPCDSDELVFCDNVFGGAVPKNYFPAVEKGLKDAMQKGVLAGFPVVGLKATLYDGSYHPVDSSEMAFKTAASIAYKTGLAQASPVLLEPVGTLEIIVPSSYMGDIMGDINKRRGRVIGNTPEDEKNVKIVAEVPESEMSSFSTELKSMTQGRGSFSFEFKSYEQVPEQIAKKVIEKNSENKSE